MMQNLTITNLSKKILNYSLKNLLKLFKLYKKLTTNYPVYIQTLKQRLSYIYNFLLLLIVYLIEKYYYKLNLVYFAIQAHQDSKIFDFFITLNTIKENLHFPKPQIVLNIPILIYYFSLLLNLVVYIPVTLYAIN